MVPGLVRAASHAGPGTVERRLALDKANALRPRVLRRHGEEPMDVLRQQMPRCEAPLLLLRQRAEALPKMPSPLMGERLPTILRAKDHRIRAVPLGMTESCAVWHAMRPLGGPLRGAPKGVGR